MGWSDTEAYGSKAQKIQKREELIQLIEENTRRDKYRGRVNSPFSPEADRGNIRQLRREIEDLNRR